MHATLVIPTRNRSAYLHRAISSVSAAVEAIVVVDDASSLECQREVLSLTQGDDRLLLLQNAERKGAAFCRNRGASCVTTEWLIFLDDDDRLMADYEDKLAAIISRHPGVRAWIPDVHGGRVRNYGPVCMEDAFNRNLVGGCSGLAIRKELFESLGGFDELFKSMQDWDLWLRLIERKELYYSGVCGVIYATGSSQKITHNLESKYQGLRRLYFAHQSAWPSKVRKYHIIRLWALRQLMLRRKNGMLDCLVRSLHWPLALVYFARWRKFRPAND